MERALPPLDPARSAVLVIDMQRDFIEPGAPIATPAGPAIVPAVNRLTALGRRLGLPIIFTQEMHRADRSDFGIELEFEPPHCLEGTAGMELCAGLDVGPDDYRILGKRRYDAFLGTDLETLLRARKIENLVVAGVCTDICVASTVQHARNADFRCVVVRECVAGTSRERHEAALLCLGHVFAYVASLTEVEATLNPLAAVGD
jgi:nicotinamidase-related amidase